MFLRKSSAIPNESEVRSTLLRIFRSAERGDLFTLDDVADQVKSVRRDIVAFLLSDLAANHVIDQFVTVMSPATHGGIQRFKDLDGIPDAIFDPFQMKEIEVDPSLIRIYFTRAEEEEQPASILSGGAGAVDRR